MASQRVLSRTTSLNRATRPCCYLYPPPGAPLPPHSTPETISETTMFIPTPLKDALKDSISSGTFIDTKFWVFSRKDH